MLPGDLALRKAIRDAYELAELPTEQEVLAIAREVAAVPQPGDELSLRERVLDRGNSLG